MLTRRALLILSFMSLGPLVTFISLFGHYETPESIKGNQAQEQKQQESYFKEIQYHVLNNSKATLSLNALELSSNSITSKSTFFAPHGVMYSKAGKPIDYTGQKGQLWQKKNLVQLDGDVKIHMDNSEILGDRVIYFMDKDEIEAHGHIQSHSVTPESGDRMEITSLKAFAWPEAKIARYLGQVDGKILRKRPYEENIYFKSDDLYSYQNQQRIDLFGNVFLEKQDLVSTGRRGEIFLENYNKRLKYFVLYDDVKLTEKLHLEGGRTLERKAFGEKLEGIMSEDKLILTGSPKVIQEKDIIKGNVIVLRENNEVVEVDDANSNFILR